MLKKRSECPVSFSLDIFGDRWTLLIIRDIMFRGKISYSEFIESEEKIATNILADRLNMLEAESILIKKVSSKNKSKYIYRLTKKGIDLLPIMIEIMQWGAKYNPDTPPKEIVKKLKQNKKGFIREHVQRLKKQDKE